MTQKKPICLKCQCLVWQGFLGICVNTVIDQSLFDEAQELGEAKLKGESEKEIAVIEQQQEIRFEKSLAYRLMAIPYMVWKRKGKVKYYEHAPKTVDECPFHFQRIDQR